MGITASQAKTAQATARKSVMIVAGEPSGDAHAARLVEELKKLEPNIAFRGMGGEHLRRAGVDILEDMNQVTVFGIVEILSQYRRIKAVLRRLQQNLQQSPPELLILVDFQEFNQRLAAYAKSRGIRVLFYIGPSVWAWRPKRVYKMAKIVDHMAVILPFEKKLYEKAGVAVTFTGHPLRDEVVRDKNPPQAREALGLDPLTTVGLFPGSRSSEISRILPVLLESAAIIREEEARHGKPPLQFVLPLAENLDDEQLSPWAEQLEALQVRCIRCHGHQSFYDIAQACELVLCTSGTAVLELGLLAVPMVIVYKTSFLTYHLVKFLATTRYIGLVNIIPGKSVVREFIQHEATADNISAEALRLLNDGKYYENMRHELSLLNRQLAGDETGDEAGTDTDEQPGSGSQKVARLALKLLESN